MLYQVSATTTATTCGAQPSWRPFGVTANREGFESQGHNFTSYFSPKSKLWPQRSSPRLLAPFDALPSTFLSSSWIHTGAFFQHDSVTVPVSSGYVLRHSLNDLYETTGGGSVQRSPALVVPSVDVAPALHQELDHLCVLINAGLPHSTRDTIKTSFTAGIAAQFRQRTNLF